MIAFFFPIILGALIGFTLDDGKINKKDFKHINKGLINPISKKLSSAKKSIVKAYEGVTAEGIPKK